MSPRSFLEQAFCSRSLMKFSNKREFSWRWLFRGRIQLDFTPYKMSQVSCPNVKHVQSSLVFRSLNLQFFVPCLCGFVRLSTTFGTWNSSQICLNLKTSTRETQQSCRRSGGGGGGGGELDGEKERKDNWKEAQSSRLSFLSRFQAFRWWRHTFLKVPLTFRGWNQIFNSIKRIKRGS